jgi:hypothetical protein
VDQNIRQYLRLTIDDASFLLPSTASLAIEKREGLSTSADSRLVAAWRESSRGRWPAYSLDSQLQPTPRERWSRAVYLNANPNPVGLVTDEIQLIPTDQLHIVPFYPLGSAQTPAGHMFNSAHVDGENVLFVLDPNAFASYLLSLEG